jgi:thioredoxin reductase (NADPH)
MTMGRSGVFSDDDLMTQLSPCRAEQAFPSLTDEMIGRVREHGQQISLPENTPLIAPGEQEVDMFVIVKGAIDVFATDENMRPTLLVRHREREFTGELDLFNSHRTMVHASTATESTLIRVPRPELRRLLRSEGDIANLITQAAIARRQFQIANKLTSTILFGENCSIDTVQLERFLARTDYPHRLVQPTAEQLGQLREAAPATVRQLLPAVRLWDGRMLYRPTKEDLAAELGIMECPEDGTPYDVAIIGGGPAGLAAAVSAASEGLSTLIIEGTALGGQAGTSSRIENYLGFATGVSGQDLAFYAQMQAQKFGARLALSRDATRIECMGGMHRIELRGGSSVSAHSVIVATGARYRSLALSNYLRYENRGIHYAATATEAKFCRDQEVVVVGGGNSAGQAAAFLARVAAHVHLIVRGTPLSKTMSQYLISRIESSDRITIHRHAEITELAGQTALDSVSWVNKHTGVVEKRSIRSLFVMIGAEPNTGWLSGTLLLDEEGFIVTGTNEGFELSRYSTSVPGIFAIGDVRSQSVKRVASAVGEGSIVISDVHRYLAEDPSAFSLMSQNAALAGLS